MALWKTIAKAVSNVADKLQQTDLPKVPRIWDTNLSDPFWASRNLSTADVERYGWIEARKQLKNEAFQAKTWENSNPSRDAKRVNELTKVNWLIPHTAILNAVTYPANMWRNLYNTVADIANAKISEHNAKAYEKRKANTRKWVLRKKADPAQYISL